MKVGEDSAGCYILPQPLSRLPAGFLLPQFHFYCFVAVPERRIFCHELRFLVLWQYLSGSMAAKILPQKRKM